MKTSQLNTQTSSLTPTSPRATTPLPHTAWRWLSLTAPPRLGKTDATKYLLRRAPAPTSFTEV